ncbi:MAG: hypothetical protein JJ939_11950 [Alphaproteobacteria bacterium]|nr:hypothetical protein [Alphaproteobacteria bacterium]MBO6629126.1 hypothetical protein [Alphaproteobacteria bacterium]MDF1624871.1 hypothetical protein [Parvibaculaceae bacterium]
MKITQLLLSACLAFTGFAGATTFASSTAHARDGAHTHYGNGGHQARRHHRQTHRQQHRRSHRRDNGGAFVAGTALGLVLGWSGGYGYPRAHHNRYTQYHRPYYAPRHRNHPAFYGHTRRHYSYSDGYHDGNVGYRSYGTRGCHPVYKHGRWNGRPAKVGGTMCYNRNGNAYVVNGSRYLIHYE